MMILLFSLGTSPGGMWLVSRNNRLALTGFKYYKGSEEEVALIF